MRSMTSGKRLRRQVGGLGKPLVTSFKTQDPRRWSPDDRRLETGHW
jgi:hypothetical protein